MDEAETANSTTYNIIELLALAAEEALSDRERLIFDLRLGLSNGEPVTLQHVGDEVGVSRERIRQIMERCVRRIRARASAQRRRQDTDGACLSLLLALKAQAQAGDPDDIDRLVEYSLPFPYQQAWIVWRLLRPKGDVPPLRRMERQRRASFRAEARRRRAQAPFERLLASVTWPSTACTLTDLPWMQREREVSLESEGHTGSFVSEKTGREVEFESGLELRFLRGMESVPMVAAYQEQPFSIPYWTDGRLHRYFPDVFVLLTDGRGLVVEIKPLGQFALHVNHVKWSALRSFCQEHGYGLLITDTHASITAVMQHVVPQPYRDAVQRGVEKGPLSWPEYRRLRDVHHPSLKDFVALVLQERLVWALLPFSLRRSSRRGSR